MKKILIALTLICTCLVLQAGQFYAGRALDIMGGTIDPQDSKITTIKNVSAGEFVDWGGVNLAYRDSIKVSDTLEYVIPVTHTSIIYPYTSFRWYKVGAGTATLSVEFYQANDKTLSWLPVQYITSGALADYTKTLTISASGYYDWSFMSDSARFEGRYLKIVLRTTSTATVHGKIAGRTKFNTR